MTEHEGTEEDFVRQVRPSLSAMAWYAARRVGPRDRDPVVQEALIRAWQGRATYDESACSRTAWLLRLTDEACRRPRPRPAQATLVELVDESVVRPAGPGADLEPALDSLDDRQRMVVDLRYFVGLDVATVAEVVGLDAAEVATSLRQVRTTLCGLTGEHDPERMEHRLSTTATRWQDEQPRPPEVPVDLLDQSLAPRRRPRATVVLAAAAVVVLVGGGVAAVVRANADGKPPAARPTGRAVPGPDRADEIVPWRDLEARHPVYGVDVTGARVTPYDHVTATGKITGTVRPGDTLVFDAGLTAPGIVSLRPCPDFTVSFGTHTVTKRLNCAQVPYYASLVRSGGRVTAFQPVLPAGVTVFFRMAVIVPDEPGRQQVRWTLVGPERTPSFAGTVEVAP
jgi:DNA-directed RNA polymerase specialized sigma24 family protein